MSAPQHISALGHRQVGYLAFGSRPVGSPAKCRWGADRSAVWRSGADLSAPQQIVVGEPTGRLSGVREQTCRLPSISALGARQVGSPENRRWGPDMSAPQTVVSRSVFRHSSGQADRGSGMQYECLCCGHSLTALSVSLTDCHDDSIDVGFFMSQRRQK